MVKKFSTNIQGSYLYNPISLFVSGITLILFVIYLIFNSEKLYDLGNLGNLFISWLILLGSLFFFRHIYRCSKQVITLSESYIEVSLNNKSNRIYLNDILVATIDGGEIVIKTCTDLYQIHPFGLFKENQFFEELKGMGVKCYKYSSG